MLTDQLGALLALGFGSEIPATPAEQRDAAGLLDQIGRAIRLRYAEPGLTAVAVAEDLRVSERTLHRCLNKAGLTFSGLLNDCRMAAARRMLSEPRFDRISIGGIGLRVGLSDPSHFIRQCRKSLGMRWMSSRLREFRADQPAIRLVIEAREELSDLSTGDVDFVVRFGEGNWPNAVADLLFGGPLVAVVNPQLVREHRLNGSKIVRGLPLIHVERTDDWAS